VYFALLINTCPRDRRSDRSCCLGYRGRRYSGSLPGAGPASSRSCHCLHGHCGRWCLRGSSSSVPQTSGSSVAFGHYGGVAEAIDRVAVAGAVIAVLERISSITCGTCHVYCGNCHHGGSKTNSTHRTSPIVNHQEPQLNLPKSNSQSTKNVTDLWSCLRWPLRCLSGKDAEGHGVAVTVNEL
jgi:hypothetical protein